MEAKTEERRSGGLDVFRMVAALMVVAIHTSPLESVNTGADVFLTRMLARVAVPFFFMVTGQFVLTDYLHDPHQGFSSIRRYLKKIAALYGLSILLYLPIGIYAGYYTAITPLTALRMLVFDGTFYHLWYFPALMLGVLLVCLLRRVCSQRACAAVAGILYLLGLLGDSYWGLTAAIPGVSVVYEAGFQLFGYTRNGLFLAPLFLLLGVQMGQKPCGRAPAHAAGFLLSLLLMTAEGFTLRVAGLPRHDSMYLLLPVCMVCLYRLLLAWNRRSSKFLRTTSTGIYILHPAILVAVRLVAKVLPGAGILVTNSLAQYLAVCVLSVGVSCGIAALLQKPDPKGRAWIELDRDALRHNVSALRARLPEHGVLMPALKANAYGHGAVQMGKELNRLGVKSFCVACVAEGVELRRHHVQGDILILGYTHPSQFPLLRRYRLTQTVIDYAYAEELNRYGAKIAVHIGIDTGMHRLGERSENIEQLCRIFEMKHLRVKGAFTHLCAADTDDPRGQAFTRQQAQRFFEVVEELKRRGYPCPLVHLQSSYGVLNYPELAGDAARVGIALYGVHSASGDYDRSGVQLQPVLSLKARVASVRELRPGEGVGYGLAFRAERPMRIATLAVGYADGWPRCLSNGGGEVLLHGRRAPVVGRICMDQTTVDVTDIPDVSAGDVAVLIGGSEGETISACEVADRAFTITNEIFSRLGARLPRVWRYT